MLENHGAVMWSGGVTSRPNWSVTVRSAKHDRLANRQALTSVSPSNKTGSF